MQYILRIIEIKNYAKRNSTIFIIRDYTIIKLIRLKHCCYAAYLLNIEEPNARRIVRGLENSALTTLIGTVLYNAIKEYYNNRIRKIIYFYSYTIENKCRISYSNKKDIEANKREKETRVQLRKLLEEIYNILLREFYKANNFIETEKYTIDNCIIYALALIKDK
ncbi:hypothetical protein HBI54_125310 [Parastagonospora nodorum]|nr:hypothetical protein HBI54_125310 [Parastagonospora nodorum]